LPYSEVKLFGLNSNFLHRIGRRHIHAGSLAKVRKVCAVEGEIVVHRSSPFTLISDRRVYCHFLRRGYICDPRQDARQRNHVPAAERKVLHAAIVHQSGKRRVRVLTSVAVPVTAISLCTAPT